MRRLPADARVIDADVQPAELPDRAVDGGGDGVLAPGVDLEVQDFQVGGVLLELRGGGLERGGLDVAEGELADAVPGEGVGGVLADAWLRVSGVAIVLTCSDIPEPAPVMKATPLSRVVIGEDCVKGRKQVRRLTDHLPRLSP